MLTNLDRFMLALSQYETIDKTKCQAVHPIVQGLLYFEHQGVKTARPFSFIKTEHKDMEEMKDFLLETRMNLHAVSFVQHYITYG